MRRSVCLVMVLAGVQAVAAGRAWADQEPVEPLPAQRTAAAEPSLAAAPGLAPRLLQARDVEAPRSWPESPEPRAVSGRHSSLAEPMAMQVAVGILWGVAVVVGAGETYASTKGNLWYTGAVAVGGALGTGAIVCAVGQLSPTRRGGCRASLVGALVGAVAAVPGMFLLREGTTTSCGGMSEEAAVGCQSGSLVLRVAGVSLAAVGYTLGTALGAETGWKQGATARLPAPGATASLLMVRF